MTHLSRNFTNSINVQSQGDSLLLFFGLLVFLSKLHEHFYKNIISMKYLILHVCQTNKTSLILILLIVLKVLKTRFNDFPYSRLDYTNTIY